MQSVGMGVACICLVEVGDVVNTHSHKISYALFITCTIIAIFLFCNLC